MLLVGLLLPNAYAAQPPGRKSAAKFDAAQGVEGVEGGEGRVARMADKGWFRFDKVNLTDVTHLTVRVAPLTRGTFDIEVHLGAPDGPLMGTNFVACLSETDIKFGEFTIPVQPPAGIQTVYVVTRIAPKPLYKRDFPPPASGKLLDISWIDFRDNPLPASARAKPGKKNRKKVLFITTQTDHPWNTHMYSAVTELLAQNLNQISDVEAIVSPNYEWPRDSTLFRGVDAVVYYSGRAGDLLMEKHRAAFDRLMKAGVGFTALHYAAAATPQNGVYYMGYAGGWWNRPPGTLNTDPTTMQFVRPDHPILQGQSERPLTDEIYCNPQLGTGAEPLIQVPVSGKPEVVAWTLERPGGGRSYISTLGHSNDNWLNEPFRRLMLNGILWTIHHEPLPAPAPNITK